MESFRSIEHFKESSERLAEEFLQAFERVDSCRVNQPQGGKNLFELMLEWGGDYAIEVDGTYFIRHLGGLPHMDEEELAYAKSEPYSIVLELEHEEFDLPMMFSPHDLQKATYNPDSERWTVGDTELQFFEVR